MPGENLAVIKRRLIEQYGEVGDRAARRLQQWLAGEVPLVDTDIIERHLDITQLALIADAFYQVLPFGTGGRRGRVGYGPNRMNRTTVGMTIQGHCDYLKVTYPERSQLSVVVANDVRRFNDIQNSYGFLGAGHPLLGESSRSLARLACEIYAANGIIAYLYRPHDASATLSTPELSFLIHALGAAGGVNLSASHNPPDDNGIKVYDAYGSQPVAPADQHLIDTMSKVSTVQVLPFAQALQQALIKDVPDGLHEQYIDAYVALFAGIQKPDPALPVVYTPLCGTGLSTVGDVLDRLGFTVLTPPDQGPDGSFDSIPFKAPNPEIPQVTGPACVFAARQGTGIVLSTDPDADRVGVEVKLADGSWYHFDGNQIAAALVYYLMLDPQGPQRKGLVIETLVTTKIMGAVVARAADSVIIDDLLVGFKYVADVLKILDREGRYRAVQGRSDDLVLAAEESHGVIMLPGIRDKDAVPACMYFAALYQRLHREGRTLLDYYIEILETLGGFDNVNRSIVMTGAEGMAQKERIMQSLRENPPQRFAGEAVRSIRDYWDHDEFGPFVSESDKLPRNVIQITTEALVVTVRPSGTEPKLKLYCQLIPDGGGARKQGHELLASVRARADAAARAAYQDLLARIDVTISETALLLPDIVDLQAKLAFDTQTLPQLYRRLQDNAQTDLQACLEWLRQASSAMTPGTDPLPALKAPLAEICRQWADEFANQPLFEKIASWTQQS